MEKTHNDWKQNKIGLESGLNGKSRIEIDESKVINFGNIVRWMFVLVVRAKYDIRTFFVNDNVQKKLYYPK